MVVENNLKDGDDAEKREIGIEDEVEMATVFTARDKK